ncbi:MAG: transcription termination/antitermination protein NusA [Alphaproteobacteria bacterium]|nr:transcription termination/antitermination protein NusA [Alphaproteobacteria bacterium]
MENIENMPRPEIVLVADAVAREKDIDKEEVFEAMEVAIQKAGRSRYGAEHDIRATIDRKTGAISLERYREVMADDAEIENEAAQLHLSFAKRIKPDAKVGEFIIDALPPIDFGRIAAQTAKQVIVQKVRDSERRRQFEEYKEKIGTIVSGTVKRAEFGSVVLDIGKTEAVLRRDEMIPREKFKVGDRVRAYVLDVRRETRGPQIFLSRTCPEFMAKLFTSEVPEIYDGIIEIMGVARDPGSRGKIAVKANDVTIDPVGACVGLRGIRVQAVVTELQGEKIDIVPYSEDRAQYLVAALAPAEVSKVVIDEESGRMEAVVPEEQFSIAVGRRGQNVKLASQLLHSDIDVLTEAEEQERRANENKIRLDRFMNALDVDDMIAHLLIAEGFTTVDEIAEVELSELAEIECFDEDIATELQNRAKEFVTKRNAEFEDKIKSLGVDDSLRSFEDLDQDTILKLAENNIKTLDDLADLSSDELVEILGEGAMPVSEANRIIMAAREHWFDDEKTE